MHQKLLEKSSKYRAWHNYSNHSFWHWIIFLAISVVAGNYVISSTQNVRYEQDSFTYELFHTIKVSAAAPTSGLIRHWKFDEGSGTTAGDSTGSSAGTISGATWTTGKIGSALSFDGANDQVSISSQSLSGSFTLSTWIKANGSDGSIFGINNRIFLFETNYAYWNNGASGSGDFDALPTGSWQHVAYTYNGTTLRGFLNGVQSSIAITSTINTGNGTFTIGNGGAGFLSASIDEVRLYNRALSATEVLDIYNDLGGVVTPPPPPPSSDTTPPSVSISSPSIGATLSGSTTVSASASDNVGIAGVQFKLDGNNLGAEDTTSPYSVSWNTTGTSNGAHTLSATARDAAGNQTTSTGIAVTVSNASSDTTPPSAPGSLSATAVSSSQIDLSWTASTDNVAVVGYQLERCQGSSCTNFSIIASPSGILYSSGSLSAATAYRFRIRATDAAGNFSSYSSIASATTQASTTPPPPPPPTPPPPPPPYSGGTINAASCNRTDVSNAINSVQNGGTVLVPAGSCSWGSGISLPSGKDLTVQGATVVTCSGTPGSSSYSCSASNNTTLTCADGCFGVNLAASHRVTGFTMTNSNGNELISSTGDQNLSKHFRIDHNRLMTTTNEWSPIRFWGGSNGIAPQGIWDHNLIEGGIAIHTNGTNEQLTDSCKTCQHQLWAKNPVLGDSTEVIYLEANHFVVASQDQMINFADGNYGARGVQRFNRMQGPSISGFEYHSVQGDNRGYQRWETYNNNFHDLDSSDSCFFGMALLRGGTGVFFDNSLTGSLAGCNQKLTIDNVRSADDDVIVVSGVCNGNSAWDQNLSGQQGYRCRDQIGIGRDLTQWNHSPIQAWNQELRPAYIFNNSSGGSIVAPDVSGEYRNPLHIKADRDFYTQASSFNGTSGVGRGTLSSRPSSCTTGVGYWTTDQGEWNSLQSGADGQLYKCTSTNTWTLYYTPYAYPHPWTTGTTVPPPPPPPPPPPSDTTAPSTPTLSATGSSNGTVSLTWTSSSDNVGVVKYNLHRSATSGFTPAFSNRIWEPMPTATSFTDTSLAAGTYFYKITAEDLAGNISVASNQATGIVTTITPPPPPPTPPPTPPPAPPPTPPPPPPPPADTTPPVISNVSVSNITQTSATITWTTDESSTSLVEYGQTTSYGSVANSTGSTSHTAILSSLSAGTTYNYRIRATDAAGNTTTRINATFTTSPAPDTTPPAAITNLVSSNLTQTSASLAWTAPGDDNNSGTAASYDLRYSTSAITSGNFASATQASGEPNPQAAGFSQTYTLVGLNSGTTYFVALRTSDEAGNVSGISNVPSFTTLTTPDTTAPSTPGNLTASVVSSSQINLSWNASTDNVGVSQYRVYRCQGTACTASTQIATSNTTSYQNTGLSASTSYRYRVRAVDTASNLSSFSSPVTATTQAAADTTPPVISNITVSSITQTTAIITWTTNEGASRQVEYGATTSYGSSSTLTPSLLTSHSVTLTGLAANTTYNFRVRSADAASNLALSTNRTFATAPAPDVNAPVPSNVIISNTTNSSVTITWITNENASSQLQYGLLDALGFQTTEIDTTTRVTAHTVTLSNLISCARYKYRVASKDQDGNLGVSSNGTFATTGCPGSAAILDVSTASIANTTGGTLNLSTSGGGLTLTIPDAFNTSFSSPFFQALRLSKAEVISALGSPSGKTTLDNHIYELRALPDPHQNLSIFSKPLSITITYANSEITGLNESSLKIYRNSGSGWTELSGCLVDQTQNKVTCATTQFSTFVVSGDTTSTTPPPAPPPPPPPPSSGGGGGTSIDITPPPQVTNFKAEGADKQIVLSWTNPASSSDWVRTIIVRKAGGAPTSATDGAVIFEGTGSTFVDVNLDNATTYYYSAFTIDHRPNYSTPVSLTATPEAGKTQTSTPQSGSSANALSGRLIKYPNNPTVYLLQNGVKRAIVSYEVYQKNFVNRPIAVIPESQTYPDGEILRFGSGTLLKTPSSPTVWLITETNNRYPFKSLEEFYRLGFRFDLVRTISDAELSDYPLASFDSLGLFHASNTFVKYANDQTVYLIVSRVKMPLTSPSVFFSYASSWSEVLIISDDIVYATGTPLAFPDGVIIKGSNSTVYLVENGLRRAFSSANAFFNLGYSFNQVTIVPDSDLGLNISGTDLE